MFERDLENVELGFDITIVGAGAAGCSLVANLSEDFKVLLIDSKNFPRKKACSGVLVSEGEEYFEDKLDNKLLVEPKELDIEYVDFDNGLRKFSKKGFLNLDRFEFDKFLFEKVKKKPNVCFLQNVRVIELTDSQDKNFKVVLCESNGLVKPIVTKYLVGCDGALSLIRRKIFSKNTRFYVGLQELIKTEDNFDKAYFIFDSEVTDFYGWVIPKKPFVDVGALFPPQDIKKRFSLFREKLTKELGIKGSGELNSAVVLRPGSLKDVCLGKDSVLLCGEAAGLISPSSAEGISFALRSGKYCAESFNANKADALSEYVKRCKPLLDRLEEKFRKSKVISDKSKRKALFS